jgi:hypothetical protein
VECLDRVHLPSNSLALLLADAERCIPRAETFVANWDVERASHKMLAQVQAGLQNCHQARIGLLKHVRGAPVIPDGATPEKGAALREKYLNQAPSLLGSARGALDDLRTILLQYEPGSDLRLNEQLQKLERANTRVADLELLVSAQEAKARELVGVLQNQVSTKHFADVVTEMGRERALWGFLMTLVSIFALGWAFAADPPTGAVIPWLLPRLPAAAALAFAEWVAVSQFSQATKQLRGYRLKQALSLEIERAELTSGNSPERMTFQRDRLRLLSRDAGGATQSDSPVEDVLAATARIIEASRK